MKRYLLSFLVLMLAALPVSAHFIWIVPAQLTESGATTQVFLSENLQPEDADFLAKIAGTELFLRSADGKTAPVKWTKGKDSYQAAVSGVPSILAGSCRYGLFQRGDAEPFLLMYYPKALLGPAPLQTPLFESAWDRLPLEILPAKGRPAGTFLVLWRNKPLTDAEVVVLSPSMEKSATKKTDDKGLFTIDAAAKGLYGLRVRQIESAEGEHDGKKYKSVRHYATLVFEVRDGRPEKSAPAPAQPGAAATIYPPLPRAVSSLGAAVQDGWLYVYGGHCAKTHEYSTEAVVGTFHRLKLSEPKTWEELPGGPAVQGLALVAHQGKLYRVGGMQPRNAAGDKADNYSLAACARFDPDSKKWETLPDLPEGRSSHDAVVVGDRLYVVGGWKMNGAAQKPEWPDTGFMLDLTKKPLQWESFPQPFTRRALTAAAWQGKVYVVGGLNAEGKVERTVNIFDPATNKWTSGPEVPGPLLNGFAPAVCTAGERLLVGPSDGKVYALTKKGDAWEEVGALRQPRLVHRLAAAPDGKVLAVGGASKQGNVAAVEAVEWLSVPQKTPLKDANKD
jgi:N-acetylneuraminic acid mutarotase/uncharacterized GH25 family protein